MNIILFEGEPFFPRGDERFSHITKVLHKGVGDSFQAGILDGPAGQAVIREMDSNGLFFSFFPENPPEPLFPVWLLVGFPRPIQLKRLLRSVSSMGAAGILLTGTDLGEKSYRSSGVFERGTVRASLIDGAMQSGFSTVSEIHSFDSVAESLEFAEGRFPRGKRVVLDIGQDSLPFRMENFGEINAGAPLLLAVGSERGWSAQERDLFSARGWVVRHLGKRIMRTETAVVAGLAVALSMGGFWDRQK